MKNVLSSLYVLMFVVLASSVFAAASFSMNDLTFGGANFVRGLDDTQTLHIINTGDQALTLDLTSNLPSVYDVRIVPSTISVPVNSSADVAVTLYVSLSQSSAISQVYTSKLTDGITATATSVSGLTKTAKVFAQAENKLEITKVAIVLNSDGDSRSVSRGQQYNKDIKPGTPVSITVTAKNNFLNSGSSSSNDFFINNIEVDAQSSGDMDLSETDSLNDLRQGEKDSVTFTTDIPTDASDGDTFYVDITVTGTDDNGATHRDTFSFSFEVRKPTHEITIKSFSLSPQKIVCAGQVTINAELQNTGRNNEDQVHLLIENNELGLSQRFYGMSLDTDESIKKTYTFSVDNTTAPGTYNILLTSFYASTSESDNQVLTLTVDPCQQSSTTTTPTTPTTPTTTPTTPTPTIPQVVPTSGATPVYGSASFTDSTAFIVVLVAAVIIILLILIILLVKFVF